jgi:hypothetical protein
VDGLEFVASLVDSLAWPTALVVMVVVLRKQLTNLLSRPGLRQLEAGPGGFKAQWDATIAETQAELESAAPVETQIQEVAADSRLADLDPLVNEHPEAAILQGYIRIERALRARVKSVTGAEARPLSGRPLVREALEVDAITQETARAIEGLIVLRNLAAHGGGGVTSKRASEFLALADSILYVLTREP